MSVLDDGEVLLARLNANERKRATKNRDELIVEVKLGRSKAGYQRIQSKSLPRWKLRELGFDV